MEDSTGIATPPPLETSINTVNTTAISSESLTYPTAPSHIDIYSGSTGHIESGAKHSVGQIVLSSMEDSSGIATPSSMKAASSTANTNVIPSESITYPTAPSSIDIYSGNTGHNESGDKHPGRQVVLSAMEDSTSPLDTTSSTSSTTTISSESITYPTAPSRIDIYSGNTGHIESGMMSSTFVPVETILKVDEDGILVEQNNTNRSQKINERPLSSIVPTSFISIGTQCPPLENERSPENRETNIISVIDRNANLGDSSLIRDSNVDASNLEETPLLIKNWSAEANTCHDDKMFIPTEFPQQIPYNFQTYPVDEKFFLQFDYKTRNKLKTKQRRLDPFYRSQERIRQRTVMRLKRQDPRFRAVEREKGRYRMRLKRLDPIFRSQERERQRERMKVKRKDPDFREREREQQKSRLHVKRLDPAFKEKERAQDRLRMRIKRQNNGLYSAVNSEKNKLNIASNCIITESQAYFKNTNEQQLNSQNEINREQNVDGISPENATNNTRLLTLKPREPTVESFHYRKAHILNFNFYNTGKEQWANHNDLYKGAAHFSVLREEEKHLVTDNSAHESHILSKDNLSAQKKLAFKPNMITETLMKIKNESPVTDIRQVEKSSTSLLNHDITCACVTSKCDTVQRLPLPSVTSNSLF